MNTEGSIKVTWPTTTEKSSMNLTKSKMSAVTLSLFFALFLPFAAYAATGVETPSLSPEQILREFKHSEKPGFRSGQFRQRKNIKDLDVQIDSSGEFQIKTFGASKTSIYWNITKPDPLQICINDQGIVMNNPQSGKKSKYKLNELSQSQHAGLTKILQLVHLNPKKLTNDFNVAKSNDTSEKSFSLIPKEKKNYDFTRTEITLDQKKDVSKVRIFEAGDDTLEFEFFQTNNKPLRTAKNDLTILKECN